MGNEDTSQSSARVIDLSAARAAKDLTMDTLTAPGPMHPAARALAQRDADAGQSTGQD
jgi:hypothetical protein